MTQVANEQKQEFMAWETMFESQGWRLLARELTAELEQSPTHYFANAKSWEELVAARVRIRVLAELLSFPAQIAQRKEAITMAADQQAFDAQEEESVENL